ncbi:MAG: RHS repeat protein, partial [Pseudonocardiales bacterium]|nr:RHS repeat protein [Pseudonocardiales bacterium]
ADIVATASYDAGCANVKTCNQPNATTDPRGNVTDYTYDPATGLATSVTLPAATAGGARPQTRYGYTAIGGVTKLTTVSACRTSASCAGGADEVRTTIAYGTNLPPVSVTSGAGDGSLSATASATYDPVGNRITVDGPLPGGADTSRTLYNADREMVGTISADPDGAGPLKNRAARLTYNADGQVTLAEQGTVTDQSDAAWFNFASLQQVASGYDANGRKVSDALSAGGTTYALTQYSYDALGRAECAAQRMNPAAFGSLPGSACTLGASGSFGPDRIARTVYNAAGEATRLQTGYGTSDQRDEVASSYTPNGKLATLADANGNLTTYGYDGFDRPFVTNYPSPTTPGVSSTTDYEGLSYDAASNVTQRRLRDGQVIYYTYDNLDRLTLKDVPNLNVDDQDVTYDYDLFGRLTHSANNPINQLYLTYDALGRRTGEANYYYALTRQYDLAGRRTRLTWNDGFYVSYDHLVTGEVSAIKENGSFVLGSYGYDDLGRRTSLTRGNGTTTTYGYDPVSRLTGLAHDLAGAASDVTTTFGGYNPAGQIGTSSRDNDGYAWNGLTTRSVAETPNGLNQLVQQGAATLTYDGRGNLISDGTRSYAYTSEDRMTSASGVSALYHDPLGRLDYIAASSGTLLGLDGDAIVSEYSYDNGPGPLLRRYVFGPGADEPLVWYEG